MSLSCVLISDITGSTQLYERAGGQVALAHVGAVLSRMRAIIEANRGHCVKSQGDDVLSHFDRPDEAFAAAWAMINEDWPASLSIHAGLYFGEILHESNDIYGNTVNTAARLASMSKPGEFLLGDECHDHLSPGNRSRLTDMGNLQLRGKESPTRVYACSVIRIAEQTVFMAPARGAPERGTASADVSFGGRTWTLGAGEKLSFGRSQECDVVLAEAWVSRRHAELLLNGAQLEFTDHSSTGSVLQDPTGRETTVHRRTTLLSGRGMIHFGIGMDHAPERAVIYATRAG